MKITPGMSAKILEMNARGKSAAVIANALDGRVTRQAVLAHLKVKGVAKVAAGAVGEPSEAAPQARPRRAAERATALAGVAADPSTMGIDDLRDLATKLRPAVFEMVDGLTTGVVGSTQFVGPTKLLVELVERIDALTPKPPPDPEADPFNVEASKRVVAKIDRAVKAAEEHLRCVHCDKHPWREGASE